MKNMICVVALFAIGFSICSGSGAAQAPDLQTSQASMTPSIPPDQQATKEQIAKLFEVMRLRLQMQSFMKMMPSMVQQQIQQQLKEMAAQMPGGAMTSEQEAAMQKMMGKYMQKAVGLYPVDEMLDDMTLLYQHHLSRSDIEAFTAFYESPAGQHVLDQQPAIMQEYMPIAMKRVQERSRALTEELMKEMQENIKSTPGAKVSSPPSSSTPAARQP